MPRKLAGKFVVPLLDKSADLLCDLLVNYKALFFMLTSMRELVAGEVIMQISLQHGLER